MPPKCLRGMWMGGWISLNACVGQSSILHLLASQVLSRTAVPEDACHNLPKVSRPIFLFYPAVILARSMWLPAVINQLAAGDFVHVATILSTNRWRRKVNWKQLTPTTWTINLLMSGMEWQVCKHLHIFFSWSTFCFKFFIVFFLNLELNDICHTCLCSRAVGSAQI